MINRMISLYILLSHSLIQISLWVRRITLIFVLSYLVAGNFMTYLSLTNAANKTIVSAQRPVRTLFSPMYIHRSVLMHPLPPTRPQSFPNQPAYYVVSSPSPHNPTPKSPSSSYPPGRPRPPRPSTRLSKLDAETHGRRSAAAKGANSPFWKRTSRVKCCYRVLDAWWGDTRIWRVYGLL
jgi:hypothetical protein